MAMFYSKIVLLLVRLADLSGSFPLMSVSTAIGSQRSRASAQRQKNGAAQGLQVLSVWYRTMLCCGWMKNTFHTDCRTVLHSGAYPASASTVAQPARVT